MWRTALVALSLLGPIQPAFAGRPVAHRNLQLSEVIRARYLAGKTPEEVLGARAASPGRDPRTAQQRYRKLTGKLNLHARPIAGASEGTIEALTDTFKIVNQAYNATRKLEVKAAFSMMQQGAIAAHRKAETAGAAQARAEAEAKAARAAEVRAAGERARASAAAEKARAEAAEKEMQSRVESAQRTAEELKATLGSTQQKPGIRELAALRRRLNAAMSSLHAGWQTEPSLRGLLEAETALGKVELRAEQALGRVLEQASTAATADEASTRALFARLSKRLPANYREHARGPALEQAMRALDLKAEKFRIDAIFAGVNVDFASRVTRMSDKLLVLSQRPDYRLIEDLYSSAGQLARQDTAEMRITEANRASYTAAWRAISTLYQQTQSKVERAYHDLTGHESALRLHKPSFRPARSVAQILADLPPGLSGTQWGGLINTRRAEIEKLEALREAERKAAREAPASRRGG